MNNIAIIFDLDGVLINSNPYHKQTWKKFCEKYNITVTDETLEKVVFGRTGDESLPILFNKPLAPAQIEEYTEEIDNMFRTLSAGCLKPVDGVVEFLESLQKDNIPRAVATSAPPANIECMLGGCDLFKYFEVIVDKTRISKGKPDPEIYLKAAELINQSPQDCIVFEDSMAGIASGKSAGMKVIGVATTHPPEELTHTDYVIKDFTEINTSKLYEIASSL